MKRDEAKLSRREVVKGVAAVASSLAIGCEGAGDESAAHSGPSGKGDDLHEETEGDAGACFDSFGLDEQELLEPIQNIVVLMMENRSFDHYFGGALGIDERREDVVGLRGDEFNLGPGGVPVEVFRATNHLVAPPPHSWDAMHRMWNNGQNDGFCGEQHRANGDQDPNAFRQVMGYLSRDTLPVLHALADAYALCDGYHCSLLGPTWPNRFYLHAGTSGGRKSNTPKALPSTVWDILAASDLRGVNYYSDVPWAAAALFKVSGFSRFKTFVSDALRGRLPPFSIIDPGFFTSSDHPGFGGTSEHPGMAPNLQLGQLFVATVYKALAESPQWKNLLFIISYDENGGFYDHVSPPSTVDERPEFRRLGFRVPALVIGPHVRRGCVDHTFLEHSSVLSTVCKRFGLEAPNERVRRANSFASAVEPSYIADPRPPAPLPDFEVDPDLLMDHLVPDPKAAPELWAAAESKQIPAELDRRVMFREDLREILDIGRDLGVVHNSLRWGRPRVQSARRVTRRKADAAD